MAKFDDDLDAIIAASTAGSTKVDSLIAMQVAQKQRLDDLLAQIPGFNPTPEQQAKIDALFVTETADAAKVQAALDANVTAP